MARLLSSICKVPASSYGLKGPGLTQSSLSIILRRPNTTPWTVKLDDYLADLHQLQIADTDEFLCRHIATERLCHDIDRELFLSDPASSVPLWDPKTLAMLEVFQARNDWTFSNQMQSLQNCKLLSNFNI